MEIPTVDRVKFLGVVLDRLAGADYLRALFSKGYKVANIITSLSAYGGVLILPSFFLSTGRCLGAL